jgi:hypothetical protein
MQWVHRHMCTCVCQDLKPPPQMHTVWCKAHGRAMLATKVSHAQTHAPRNTCVGCWALFMAWTVQCLGHAASRACIGWSMHWLDHALAGACIGWCVHWLGCDMCIGVHCGVFLWLWGWEAVQVHAQVHAHKHRLPALVACMCLQVSWHLGGAGPRLATAARHILCLCRCMRLQHTCKQPVRKLSPPRTCSG